MGLGVETGGRFLRNSLLLNLLQCYPREFGGGCPPALTDTVTRSPRTPPPASLNPVIEAVMHLGASRAILEVSALAVITWCQGWCPLSPLRTPRQRALIAEAEPLSIDVLGAGAAAADSQPLRSALTPYHLIQSYFYSPSTLSVSFSLGHLVLIIFQEMRANKRKPFCYEYTCILKCRY